MEALKAGLEAQQEGWRSALADKARRQLAEAEAGLRERLRRERDAEIGVVLQRLEAEGAAGRDAAVAEAERRGAAAAERAAAEAREARKAEARIAEKFRSVAAAHKALEERAGELRGELEAKGSTIRFLESQVAASREETARREADLRSLSEQKECLSGGALRAPAMPPR